MIQKGTRLLIGDNSGAKVVECIHVYKGYRRRYAKFGDEILVAIKSLRKRSKKKAEYKVKKGGISKAVVVQTASNTSSDYSTQNKFYQNFVILISNQQKYIGTRVFIPLEKNLRYTEYLKLLSISVGTIK